MSPYLDEAARIVVAALPLDPEVRQAWRTIWRALRRGDRITSRTLPRIAGLAQHAVAAREDLDALIREIDPRHYARATDVRTHLVAILTAIEEESTRRAAYEDGRA